MIYLSILAIIVSLVALFQSFEAKQENLGTSKRLVEHTEVDLKNHKLTSTLIDLIIDSIEKEGGEE